MRNKFIKHRFKIKLLEYELFVLDYDYSVPDTLFQSMRQLIKLSIKGASRYFMKKNNKDTMMLKAIDDLAPHEREQALNDFPSIEEIIEGHTHHNRIMRDYIMKYKLCKIDNVRCFNIKARCVMSGKRLFLKNVVRFTSDDLSCVWYMSEDEYMLFRLGN